MKQYNIAKILHIIAVLWAPLLFGHTASSSALYLDVGKNTISVELHLPIDQLILAAPEIFVNQLNPDLGVNFPNLAYYLEQHLQISSAEHKNLVMRLNDFSIEEQASIQYVVAKLTFRTSEELISSVNLYSDLILHRVFSHRIYVSLRSDIYNGMLARQINNIDMIRYKHTELRLERQPGSRWLAFQAMFKNGVHHIANGTDHLMFLLCLLLPAPLLAANGKWQRVSTLSESLTSVIKIVTAFTLGHSLTLSLVVFGLIKSPVQQVEILVALSVIVSAIYALRPFFQYYASFIALGFGLVHGMAFATEMLNLGFSLDAAILATIGFNLGVESFQILIVIAIMPWFFLLARTPFYMIFRWVFAAVAMMAAGGWLSERILGWQNQIEPLLDWSLQSPVTSYLLLICVCVCARCYSFASNNIRRNSLV